MSRVLRLATRACPAHDRPWLNALLAEVDAIEPGPARWAWLAGAVGLLFAAYRRVAAAAVSPAALLLLAATALTTWLALVEYEGFGLEDDWYGPVAGLFASCLLGVSAVSMRRAWSLRP